MPPETALSKDSMDTDSEPKYVNASVGCGASSLAGVKWKPNASSACSRTAEQEVSYCLSPTLAVACDRS